VSVVIPCHNHVRYVRESIESALAQAVPPLEVIVVDDGSTDGSVDIIRSISSVRCISLAKCGVSVARNRGLAESAGEFVLFLDADDRLLPNAIEVGLQAFEHHPECGFVYGFAGFIDGAGAPIGTAHPPRRVTNAGYEALLAGSPPAPASAALFRRSALEAVGGFRAGQELAQDLDVYLRVARLFPVFCHQTTITEYRRHGGNTSTRSPSRALRAAHATLERQRAEIGEEPRLLAALEDGKRYFNGIFGESVAFEMFELLRKRKLRRFLVVLPFALRHSPGAVLDASAHYSRRLQAMALSLIR
jgi:glycosyltransferase involved in cell wall biosynthesis